MVTREISLIKAEEQDRTVSMLINTFVTRTVHCFFFLLFFLLISEVWRRSHNPGALLFSSLPTGHIWNVKGMIPFFRVYLDFWYTMPTVM